jgi:hypothetical protein
MSCLKNRQEGCKFREALTEIKDLDTTQKKLIEERYICLLAEFQRRAKFYALLFHTCRFIITVGSLIVPALLSIQYVDAKTTSSQMDPQTFAFQIYWTTWVISLLVTTSNGIFTLFKVDKKYFLLHTMLEQLRSEGWQYLELSGKFSGFYTPKERATHQNQFLYFCHSVEKLKMRQVEEEYYKSTEANLHGSTQTHANGGKTDTGETEAAKNSVIKNGATAPQLPAFFSDGLIPPTPLNPQLQQLLQALTVDGVSSGVKTTLPPETTSEVSVRSQLQPKTIGKEPILQTASKSMSPTESTDGLGTEVRASEVEPKLTTENNA